jgi:hypothetical protein
MQNEGIIFARLAYSADAGRHGSPVLRAMSLTVPMYCKRNSFFGKLALFEAALAKRRSYSRAL